MLRKQLYIDEELDAALKALAARTALPEAEHVRRALRDYLSQEHASGGFDALLAMADSAPEDDGPTDTATEHDHYLYGAPKRAGRPPAA